MADELNKLMASIKRDEQRRDMRDRGVSYGNPKAIEDGIADVVKMIQHTARMILAGSRWNDLTEEGKRKEWESKTAIHRTRLERLEKAMGDLVAAADSRLEKAWEKLWPVATGEQATQTAEMFAARVLGRGQMDVEALDKIAGEVPSPGRTIVLGEIVARGWFDQDTVDGFLASDPEYQQISREVAAIKADVSVLNMQLGKAKERLESIHAATVKEFDYFGGRMTGVQTEGVGEFAPHLESWDFPNRGYTERY